MVKITPSEVRACEAAVRLEQAQDEYANALLEIALEERDDRAEESVRFEIRGTKEVSGNSEA